MKKRIYVMASIVFIIDQITKILVNLFRVDSILINDFFYLTYVENKGAAWGILNNNLVLLIGISILALLIINKYIKTDIYISKIMTISYGLLLGGIFGNLIDRIFRGFVVDFLNFYVFSYDFPVFNIADTCIVIGVVLMIIEVVRSEANAIKSRRG